jgi:hypothetical protein
VVIKNNGIIYIKLHPLKSLVQTGLPLFMFQNLEVRDWKIYHIVSHVGLVKKEKHYILKVTNRKSRNKYGTPKLPLSEALVQSSN